MTGVEKVTAILGVAGLLATVAATWIQACLGNRRHARQLAHDRIMADRGALRDVLDDAAIVLRRALWAIDDLLDRFRAGDVAGIEERARHSVELTRQASGRLALRLGRDELAFVTYERAATDIFRWLLTRALDAFVALLGELHAATPGRVQRYFLLRRQGVAASYESIATKHYDALHKARNDFIDAAHELLRWART